jgi:hypothetical protein
MANEQATVVYERGGTDEAVARLVWTGDELDGTWVLEALPGGAEDVAAVLAAVPAARSQYAGVTFQGLGGKRYLAWKGYWGTRAVIRLLFMDRGIDAGDEDIPEVWGYTIGGAAY